MIIPDTFVTYPGECSSCIPSSAMMSPRTSQSTTPGQTCFRNLESISDGVAHSKYHSHNSAIRARSGSRLTWMEGSGPAREGEVSGYRYECTTSGSGNASVTLLAHVGFRLPIRCCGSVGKTSQRSLRHPTRKMRNWPRHMVLAALHNVIPRPYLTIPKAVCAPQPCKPC
jgi:hypothetical protein